MNPNDYKRKAWERSAPMGKVTALALLKALGWRFEKVWYPLHDTYEIRATHPANLWRLIFSDCDTRGVTRARPTVTDDLGTLVWVLDDGTYKPGVAFAEIVTFAAGLVSQ